MDKPVDKPVDNFYKSAVKPERERIYPVDKSVDKPVDKSKNE